MSRAPVSISHIFQVDVVVTVRPSVLRVYWWIRDRGPVNLVGAASLDQHSRPQSGSVDGTAHRYYREGWIHREPTSVITIILKDGVDCKDSQWLPGVGSLRPSGGAPQSLGFPFLER